MRSPETERRNTVPHFFCDTERVKQVQQQLRREERALDREMRNIDQAVTKAKGEVKRLATKGDTKSARILAREVVRSQKQKNRLALSKARMNSIGMQLQHQMGAWRVPRAAVGPVIFF